MRNGNEGQRKWKVAVDWVIFVSFCLLAAAATPTRNRIRRLSFILQLVVVSLNVGRNAFQFWIVDFTLSCLHFMRCVKRSNRWPKFANSRLLIESHHLSCKILERKNPFLTEQIIIGELRVMPWLRYPVRPTSQSQRETKTIKSFILSSKKVIIISRSSQSIKEIKHWSNQSAAEGNKGTRAKKQAV